MTFQRHDGSAGPERVLHKLSPEAEFLLLMNLKQQTENRLDELAEIICPDAPHLSLADFRGMAPAAILSGAKPLPRSGLTGTIVPAPNSGRPSFLFKGGFRG